MRDDGELAAALVGSNDLEFEVWGLKFEVEFINNKLQITRQLFAFFNQRSHSRFFKNIKGCFMSSHGKDRSVAHLPSFCRWHGFEFFFHLEAISFIMSPPACKARHGSIFCMPLMDIRATHAS